MRAVSVVLRLLIAMIAMTGLLRAEGRGLDEPRNASESSASASIEAEAEAEAGGDPCASNLQRKRMVFGGALWDGNSSDGSPVFTFARGDSPSAVAHGVYVDSSFTTSNFGKLRIVTQAGFPDAVQMAAAGWLEGWLTAERIFDHFTNIQHYFQTQLYPGVDMERPWQWVRDQEEWTKRQVRENSETDSQWRVIGLVIEQFEGLVAGYQARADHDKGPSRGPSASFIGHAHVGDLTRDDLIFLNNNGELYDIIDSYSAADDRSNKSKQRGTGRSYVDGDPDSHDPRVVFRDIALKGKCTALIKVAGDLSDIFMGHSTWDSYTSALRIYKMYELDGLSDPAIKSRRLSFSSYPGEVFSDDDFYITDAKLVILETTNHIFNVSLLSRLSPESLPSWQRVRTANLMASSGKAWVELFKFHNSGTYNNQYMVLDLNQFVPKLAMNPGMLWVVEQIPGTVYAADVTNELARGYWPSYNVPYFEYVYNATGYQMLVEKYGTKEYHEFGLPLQWLKYHIAPRANIFRRDQGKIKELRDIRDLMRMNGYQTDKYSLGNALAAVCGRGDLNDPDIAQPRGCYDSKITSYKLALQLESEVVNGPTTTQTGEPFKWGKQWNDFMHRGHPEVFNFAYERMTAVDLPLQGCWGPSEH